MKLSTIFGNNEMKAKKKLSTMPVPFHSNPICLNPDLLILSQRLFHKRLAILGSTSKDCFTRVYRSLDLVTKIDSQECSDLWEQMEGSCFNQVDSIFIVVLWSCLIFNHHVECIRVVHSGIFGRGCIKYDHCLHSFQHCLK